MSNPTLPKKKTPCEECRDQKRKCNGQKPCERCYKFNLDCIYTLNRSPRDEEYIELAKRAALISQIESMTHQIKEMETLMSDLKTQQQNRTSSLSISDIPSMTDDNSDKSLSSFEDINSVTCSALPSIPSYTLVVPPPPNKRIKLFEKPQQNIQAFLTSKSTKPWKLTLQQGEFIIETNIRTHTELLDHIHRMMGSVELLTDIPPLLSMIQQPTNSLLGMLNSLIRKRYGRTHCKNVAKSIRIFVTPTSQEHILTIAKSPDSIQITTLKLLAAYLQCQHLQQLAIHVNTFQQFLGRPQESSAVMALCAAICTMRCQHINAVLSSATLVEYGQFYFERARQLVSEEFDTFDLETLTAYTFMTVYALAVSRHQEAILYSDLAERIAIDLPDSSTHARRLRNHLHRVLTYERISRPMTTNDSDLPYCTLVHLDEGKWETAPNDSPLEKRFAMMHNYILKLQRSGHEASRAAQSCDLQHLVGLIGHQVEMAIRHWYQQLPPHFRLSIPLFDANLPCKSFFEIVQRECQVDAIPVLMTLALYEEWLVLGQSYLPRDIPEDNGCTPSHSTKKRWEVRAERLIELRNQIDFEGSDEDYLVAVNQLMAPIETRVNTDIVLKSLHAAFNTVRLVNYLRGRRQDCYFDMRVLVNVWQLLVRVSRLERVLLDTKITELMPRIRRTMAQCMRIAREELKMQPCQGTIGNYVAEMERELEEGVQDDCNCVACPNA
ncbi:uncharacterized protein BX663DRAFT_562941 [Cokeromyces recurvatus]|uniref:uncharacterized protein n=1 Tax=Cokeromyces recurvatus TaxID=90255 RepID=UPI002220C802|nr:uncharacterized protein BX663DRAFT_562941 [Cokeromyces recurvatus]KAI7900583.1 hypothetical protein BX663DRAFT_562941 [Cokeromyces recurvatus]